MNGKIGYGDVVAESPDKKLLELKKIIAQQAGLIHRLRAECKRLRTLRLRIATGELADKVDMDEEIGKQKEFIPAAIEEWNSVITLVRKAAEKDPSAAEALKLLE